jgi:DNA mismatch repair protein MutS2
MASALRHSSARVLEWELLLDLLRGYTQSPLGQERVARLTSSEDPAWIERQQELTAEIRAFLKVGARFDFHGLQDPAPLLDRAQIEGSVLAPEELLHLLLLLDRADEWRALVQHPPANLRPGSDHDSRLRSRESREASPWPAVAHLSGGIADFTELLRFFRNKIQPGGVLEDRASPDLARIRREIEKQKRVIQDSLRSYARRLAAEGAAQEELVTIRGERFVIPVKAEQKRRVQGVVHGVSSSGQTVFVEPLETIEQNNSLVRLLEEEQEEIRRILLEMTARIRARAGEIATAAELLGELELQFAKASFAEDYACVQPQFLPASSSSSESASSAALILRNARHPLLERTLRSRGAAIVPTTIELGAGHRQLIITGPNTGGKTVALKTVGLLMLMAQAGIPVPAEQAGLPIMRAVYADIGDYQSIEQNLSTFSAHITHIDFISRSADEHSLVLLDELGSATDPEEGAALAVAIAAHFHALGALTVISTHHAALKLYALNRPGVLNAAVGFDESKLQPTYELRLGLPGASAGINIAERLGLRPEIIQDARARLGAQDREISRFLAHLHSEIQQLEADRERLRMAELDLAREKQRLDLEGAREQKQRVRELEQKLESLLRDFEFRARETVAALHDRATATRASKDAERRIARLQREFREQFNQAVVAHTTGADRGDRHAQPHIVQVSEGDTVRLKSLGSSAVVRRKLAGDHLEVEAGSMKMRVPLDDVAEVVARASESPIAAARAQGVRVHLQGQDLHPSSELNVIGRTVEEAIPEVEKFIDRAFLAGLPRVRIVHGSGMGVLRKALRAHLQSHPNISAIKEPPQHEGGSGATIVEFHT